MSYAATVRRMRQGGIVHPVWTRRAAARAGLHLSLACAFLGQESAGGENVFGHDATIFAGAGQVTREKYLAYRAERRRTGQMQGVGPMQLTWYAFQDRADLLGGCWKPYWNMLVGFEQAAALIRAHGEHAGVAAYNGAGPAAQRYADEVVAQAARWHKLLA